MRSPSPRWRSALETPAGPSDAVSLPSCVLGARSLAATAADLAASGFLVALLVLVLVTFRDYGVTFDEGVQDEYGRMILSWYATLGEYRGAVEFMDLYFYGGLFDTVAALANLVSPFGHWETRHLLNALVGLLGITGTWALARRLGGAVAGLATRVGGLLSVSYLLILLGVHALSGRPGWAAKLARGLRVGTLVALPALLVGLSFRFLLSRLRGGTRLALVGALLLGAAAQAHEMAKLHPYEYVYYNDLVGGLRGAAGRFETEYWGASLTEAADRLRREVLPGLQGRPLTVTVCGNPAGVRDRLPASVTITNERSEADLFIATTRHRCHEELSGRTVPSVDREGVPFAVVKDLRSSP